MQKKIKLILFAAVVFCGVVFEVNFAKAANCVCGGSSGKGKISYNMPTTDLCSTGELSSGPRDNQGTWVWYCSAADNSCSMQACYADRFAPSDTPCVCGSSNNGTFDSFPTDNLCQTGSYTGVNKAVSDGWYWNCDAYQTDNSCSSTTCFAKKTSATASSGCSCEDPEAKTCYDIACGENCLAGYTKYNTPRTEIPNYVTACGGTSSTTACATVCVPSASCTKKTTGSCSKSGEVCCASSGTTGTTGTTGSTGVVVPKEMAGLPTNANLVKGIFTNVANFLLSVIGIIAIIAFVISGIQYFLVATDEKMMEKAKKTMVTSIIGLVVALFGYIAVKTIEMLLKG